MRINGRMANSPNGRTMLEITRSGEILFAVSLRQCSIRSRSDRCASAAPPDTRRRQATQRRVPRALCGTDLRDPPGAEAPPGNRYRRDVPAAGRRRERCERATVLASRLWPRGSVEFRVYLRISCSRGRSASSAWMQRTGCSSQCPNVARKIDCCGNNTLSNKDKMACLRVVYTLRYGGGRR